MGLSVWQGVRARHTLYLFNVDLLLEGSLLFVLIEMFSGVVLPFWVLRKAGSEGGCFRFAPRSRWGMARGFDPCLASCGGRGTDGNTYSL